MRAPIQAIAFDLWNTLAGCFFPVNPMVRLREAVRAAGGSDAVRLVAECTMRAPLPGIEAAVRALEARLGRPLARGEERSRLLRLWARTAGCNRLFDDVEPALLRLKRRYRIGLITNTQSFDMEFWERSKARRLLEVEILSYREGTLKPDPRLFERFAEAAGIEPGRILMVGDNSEDDVRGARAAGFQAVRIVRPLPALSHREPAREDAPLSDLEDLERRLASAGAQAPPRRAVAARSGARPRRAAASRRRRR